MPRRDPLPVLARVRAIKLDAARRVMAAAEAEVARILVARQALEDTRRAEAATAPAAGYAAWRPAAAAAGQALA
ncbi:hypothetical protein, partial [Falsiroseomonas sp. CW058]|uniref:hypothetical protein n=1 Tax=Falsiroseomonas sp. CW058 TaxID=3388664 RepID=UPI003D31505F